MSYLIQLEQVTKTYQLGANTVHALKGINFAVSAGEMTAIVGASGSGKSTLMNIIGFLDRGTSGSYYFSGENITQIHTNALADIRNQKIGFVFQSFFLLPRLSAVQNVMLPLFYRNQTQQEAYPQAMAMLEKMDVAHLATHKPNQLSGGQQQRVAIARALVGDPAIILADEPTGALDSETGDAVMRLLTRLNQDEGRTILIITHDYAISQRCSRTVMMKDGMIE